MRITILISLFIWTSCNGQQRKTNETSVENFKLTPPNPELIDKDLTLSEVYKNYIAFKLDKNVVVLNEQQNFLNKGKDFEDFMLNHSKELKKRKLFILYDSSIKYSEIINLLDLFQTLKIENFKIIDMDLYFKSPPPFIVDSPKYISSKLNLNDSTNFVITIVDNSIDIQLLKRNEHFKSQEELDKFIKTNLNKIDISKIYLKSIASLPYDKFKNVIAILKKYEFYNFKIIGAEN